MNKDIKDRWVKALRSGKYRQGHNSLKYKESYCCLGVLCDLHAKETKGSWETKQAGYDSDLYWYKGSKDYLPLVVRKWASTVGSDLCVKIGNKTTMLSGHNDNHKSFKQIAKAIEEQL